MNSAEPEGRRFLSFDDEMARAIFEMFGETPGEFAQRYAEWEHPPDDPGPIKLPVAAWAGVFRELREEMGMSAHDLAAQAGVPLTTLVGIEEGSVAKDQLYIADMEALSAALETTVIDVCKRVEERVRRDA